MTFDTARAAMLRRKVAWRIMPLVILLYLVAYLDRANVGFAKLRMARDLQFSDEVFGLGIGIFFLGYLTLEIPGALLVERWSARKWFARILITWGLISACTAFVRTPIHVRLQQVMADEKVDEKAALKKIAKERGISKSEAYRELQRSK